MFFVKMSHLDLTDLIERKCHCWNVVWMESAADCRDPLFVELQYSSKGCRYERISRHPSLNFMRTLSPDGC